MSNSEIVVLCQQVGSDCNTGDCNWGVPGSNLGCDTNYPLGFSWLSLSLHTDARIMLWNKLWSLKGIFHSSCITALYFRLLVMMINVCISWSYVLIQTRIFIFCHLKFVKISAKCFILMNGTVLLNLLSNVSSSSVAVLILHKTGKCTKLIT